MELLEGMLLRGASFTGIQEAADPTPVRFDLELDEWLLPQLDLHEAAHVA